MDTPKEAPGEGSDQPVIKRPIIRPLEHGGLLDLLEMRLARAGGEKAYIPGAELAKALRTSPEVPLPPRLHDYVCRYLEGAIRRPRGRRPNALREVIGRSLVPYLYQRYLDWLQRRQGRLGLDGWSCIREAPWWQGPPHERAARMVAQRLPNVDYRHILNLVSSSKSSRN